MKLHHVALSVLIVGILVAGLGGFLLDLGEHNGATADMSSLNKTATRLAQQRNDIENSYHNITGIIPETPAQLVDVPYRMIMGGWTATKVLFGSISVVGGIISDINKGLADAGIPLPDWLVPTIIAIFLLLAIAMAIYAFFKWKFED